MIAILKTIVFGLCSRAFLWEDTDVSEENAFSIFVPGSAHVGSVVHKLSLEWEFSNYFGFRRQFSYRLLFFIN